MKNIMYRRRLIIGTMLFSIFIILCQSTNATQIISKSQENITIKNMAEITVENKINSVKECVKKIESFMSGLPTEGIQSLHDIVMIVWEIISIFIGHNAASLLLTRLCCCWFVFPIVTLSNIININVTGNGLFALIQEYFDGIDIEDLIYRFGALSLIIIPVVYVIVFFIALIYTMTDGTHIEGGVLDGIRKDLEYIYTPDYNVGMFKPDNNDKSNYTFIKYVRSLDIESYLYHTGCFGLSLSPAIIFILMLRFIQLVR